MRLEKKDLFLLIPGTLLAIAGLGPDDPWVVGPCLFFSWATFVVICAIHEGSRKIRVTIGLVITLALGAVGYRRLYSINANHKETNSDLSKALPEKKELPSIYFNLIEVHLIAEDNPSYPIGSLVGGIPWKKGNVVARVSLSNETSIKAYDVDLRLAFDTSFIRVAQITQVPNIIIQPEQREKISEWSGGSIDPTGKVRNKVSATPEELQALNTYPTNAFIFKQTETLSGLPVRLVFVSGSGYKSGNFVTNLFGSVRAPKSLTVTGNYKVKYDELEYTIDFYRTIQAVEQHDIAESTPSKEKL